MQRRKFSRIAHYFRTKAVEKFVSEVYEIFESKLLTGELFIDLSKAFDTVSPIILKLKLKYYGLEPTRLNPLMSYLSNIMQLVKANGHCQSYYRLLKAFPLAQSWNLLFVILMSMITLTACHVRKFFLQMILLLLTPVNSQKPLKKSIAQC